MLAERFAHLPEIERHRIVMPPNTRLRLNRLERPQPWGARFLETLRASLPLDTLQEYPAYGPFYDRLARFEDWPASGIVVGAGIEEFIRALMLVCPEPRGRVAVLWPTCAMVDVYARAFQIELVRIVTDPAAPPTLTAILAQLPRDVKLFLLANPGQPVETCFDHYAIEAFAGACRDRGAVLAVDEAYYGFGAPTVKTLALSHENVVVLRTFSKAFGAASIRLGYALGSGPMIAALNAVRQSGEVSALSMHIATALMDSYETVVRPGIDAVRLGRDMFLAGVLGLGFNAWGRYANHVLIELPSAERALSVAEGLAACGVLVRAGLPAPVDRHLLVTCGGLQIMRECLRELRRALQ